MRSWTCCILSNYFHNSVLSSMQCDLTKCPIKNHFQRAVTFSKGCCETNLSVNLKCAITWAHVPKLTPLFSNSWPLKFTMSQPYLSNAHRPSSSSSYNFFCFFCREILFSKYSSLKLSHHVGVPLTVWRAAGNCSAWMNLGNETFCSQMSSLELLACW